MPLASPLTPRRRQWRSTLLLLALAAFAAGCGNEFSERSDGVRAAPIVNGELTDLYPAIGMLRRENGEEKHCTGSLIAPNSVLTAAHCVDEEMMYSFAINGMIIPISTITAHPEFAYTAEIPFVENDFAVAILSHASGVDPMPIATFSPTEGRTLMLVGFGNTSEESGDRGVKRHVRGKIAEVGDTYIHFPAHDSYEGLEEGSICNGDSGGPSLVLTSRGLAQIGIHVTKGDRRWKDREMFCGEGGSDLRIDAHLSFIESALAPGDRLIVVDQEIEDMSPFSSAENATGEPLDPKGASEEMPLQGTARWAEKDTRPGRVDGTNSGAGCQLATQSPPLLGSILLFLILWPLSRRLFIHRGQPSSI